MLEFLATTKTPPSLGAWPYIVLTFYLVGLLGLGVISLLRSRRADNAETDYYLAGRGQGVVVTSLTIMATYFSSFAILTFPGWMYEGGIAPMLYALNLPVAAAAIYLLGNRIRRIGRKRGYITPTDMVTDYYGDSSVVRGLVALTGALYVIPYVIMQIKGGGLLADGLFREIEHINLLGWRITMEDAGVAALSLVTMVYVIIGGMRSVAWTDVMQGIILLSAMVLSGVAVMYALEGPSGFFSRVSSELGGDLLTVPEPGDANPHNTWKLMTFCAFASLASIIQPAQWMRFYAARDSATLRRSAIAFSTILPICFIFGVFLVGLGGRVLYEPQIIEGTMLLTDGSKVDQVLIHVIQDYFPEMFGAVGIVLVALILVAVMAASMSTADSNLHALSAIATRDLYQPLKKNSSGRERTWIGRLVIVLATIIAATITFMGKDQKGLLDTITAFFFLAMAFSAQLLPITIDILFLRRGSRTGAIAGLAAGLLTVCLFPPLGKMILGETSSLLKGTSNLKALFDVGMCGIIVNALVFTIVSRFSPTPDQNHREAFARDLRGGS
ncbi:MAG: sodium:solute symporter family protein [Verrucomicrobiota bacterium]|nr:sodium:solute symporter family protein [Verrucomicrobiota bacterium]